MSEQITEIQKSLVEINKNLESKYLTKSEFKTESDKLVETVTALNKEMDLRRLETKTNPVFGTLKEAHDFIDVMKYAIATSGIPEIQKAGQDNPLWHLTKDLNTYGSATGLETVPTLTSPVMSFLLAQYGVARRNATVLNDVHGNIVLTKRSGTSSAAYTASGNVSEEDVAVTPSVFGTAKITLTPAQISTLSLVSDKLLYASAINVAEMVAIDLAEQTGVLEDNTVLRGDGTSTYGGNTGLANASCPSATTSASAGFIDLDSLLALPSKVHESVYSSPNAKFYLSGAIAQVIKQKKASTSGIYFLDPETGKFNISGYGVEIWHRVDNTVANGKLVVWFGDMRKAVTIAIGRDTQLVVSRERYFNTNQTAFRLTEDFSAGVIQPSAMASLTLTS